MKIFDKIMDTINLNGDDNYDDDGYYDSIDDDDEDDDNYYEPAKFAKSSKSSSNKVVSMKNPSNRVSSSSKSEVCVVKPTSMEDAKEIADVLRAGNSVIINLEGIRLDISQRIIDFSAGACYSVDGTLRKIAASVFIITPNKVTLSGDFQELVDEGISAKANKQSYRYR